MLMPQSLLTSRRSVLACGAATVALAGPQSSGVYAACLKLREAVAQNLGFNVADATFTDGQVRSGGRSLPLAQAARDGELVVEDAMEFGGGHRSL